MSSKIVVIGSSNTDMVIRSPHLPAPGETVLGGEFFMNPGGKGANQAVAAARLGGKVAFVARVGDDPLGHRALEGLKDEGVNIEHVALDPDAPSGVATIMVDHAGENSIAVASGANQKLSPADVDRAITAIEAADVLLMQLESPLPAVEHAARLGRDRGKLVILNPAPACDLPPGLFATLDVITPNRTEAALLTGLRIEQPDDVENAARTLRQDGVKTVIITLGPRGAFVLSDSFAGLIPAPAVHALDTTAAGDTFNGALAVALANGRTIEAATRFANTAAAISATRLGAQSSTPHLDELPESD